MVTKFVQYFFVCISQKMLMSPESKGENSSGNLRKFRFQNIILTTFMFC